MIVINREVIKSLNPCPSRYENYLRHYVDFYGTIEDFLFLPRITHQDKLWVSLRLLSRENLEAFALDCAISARKYASAYAAAYAAAAYAANAAAYAANAAAYAAAANAAYAAANAAADADAERAFQIEALIWLFKSEE